MAFKDSVVLVQLIVYKNYSTFFNYYKFLRAYIQKNSFHFPVLFSCFKLKTNSTFAIAFALPILAIKFHL